jgi:hypothetical protein
MEILNLEEYIQPSIMMAWPPRMKEIHIIQALAIVEINRET